MYKSPIDLLVADIQHQFEKQQDEEIYKAVIHYVPNVDKAELLRALEYDRQQYERGYADGLRDGTPKWIPVTERLPDYGQQVIVYLGNLLSKQVMAYQFWSEDFSTWAFVTHWMPLPSAPKGE